MISLISDDFKLISVIEISLFPLANGGRHNNFTTDYDSDEEFELNDNLDVIDNVNISKNRGMRLFADIKQELCHTFFKVSSNNENKFLHKQAACWVLEKEKSSLSADRLSRVQGR
jgi:hypothetical protein